MSMILQMAINLFADSADMLQPFIETDLILCLLRNSNHHTPDCPRRNDVANQHYFAVTAAHYIIYNSAERRFCPIGCAVVQA